MKTWKDFINESYSSKEERDLGYGIKTNTVNILKVAWYEDDEKIREFVNLFGIPIKVGSKRNPKHELKKIINELTLKDIENGIIILFGNKVLQMNHNDFKNEITYNNINIMPLSRSYKKGYDVVLNRQNIKIEDAKQVILAHRIKSIKKKIAAKDDVESKDLEKIYNEFGIDFRYIDKRIHPNITDLVKALIEERNKS